jgi:hypothetical protein
MKVSAHSGLLPGITNARTILVLSIPNIMRQLRYRAINLGARQVPAADPHDSGSALEQ